ncbi:solute carrier family 15 member 4-like isoform X2 [Lineus longissimus]
MLQGVACYTILPFVATFCRDGLDLSKTNAVIIYLVFSGIVYMVPCASGALSDTAITRYTCLLVSLVLFLIGSVVLLSLALVLTTDIDRNNKIALYVVSLVFMGLGYGFSISNMYTIGIDQVAHPTLRNVWSFFIWKHWFFSLGKLISYLPLPFLLRWLGAHFGENTLLPNAIVVVIAVGLSLAILLLGKRQINIVQPQGRTTFQRLKNGFSRCLPCFCRENHDYVSLESSASLTNERRYNRLLLKNVVLLIALFSICGGFNMFRTQLTSTFVIQAEYLRNTSPLPAISINMFCPLVVLLFVPLIEIYNRYKQHWKNMTNLDIMLAGLVPLVCSALAAAILETFVKGALTDLPDTQHDSGISFLAQGPQYVLNGLADVLSFIPGTEFAYRESPRHIEGFIVGMLYSTGSFLALTIFVVETVIFKKYVTDELLVIFEYHFYTLLGTAVGMAIFLVLPIIVIYRRFKEKSIDPLADDLAHLFNTRDSERGLET